MFSCLPFQGACIIAVVSGALIGLPASVAADGGALEHFERKIRPLLIEQCHNCHAGTKSKGGLLLDSRDGFLKGGDSGPAIVLDKPEESLLIQAVRQTHAEVKMPPKNKLSAAQADDLAHWIRQGAPYPTNESNSGVVAVPTGIDLEAGRKHWAFQPLRSAALPRVNDANWGENPIDQFVLAKLEAAGLKPAPQADKRTLLRRATFDLIGLPPTVEEIAAFLADESPQAFAKLVDRLLASPRYGERWGRYWLDLARYADSNGSDENKAYANAWRYRDYVIDAFNRDKPYDQFLTEQIAGDLMPDAKSNLEQYERWTATGFLVLGPKMLAEQDKVKLVMDIVDEQIDVLGQTVLGLTLGCARCHDHKFDPISAADYYALAGIFKSTRTMENLDHVSRWMQRAMGTPSELAAASNHAKALAELEKRIAAAEKDLKKKEKEAEGKIEREESLKAMREELKNVKANAPASTAHVMAVEDAKAVEVPIHIRGSHLNLAAKPVPRAEPQVLSHLAKMPEIPNGNSGRLQLAKWITDPANPLTARVMVNRIWQGHFGNGLVRSPSNFGLRGEVPTHPELLDHLARLFIVGDSSNPQSEIRNPKSAWSIKSMHRTIMLSKTYQMSTQHDSLAASIDPDNRLLWRMNRRRLEAEPVRDALLAVSGKLDVSMGGTLLPTKNDDYVSVSFRNGGGDMFKTPRRAVYLPVVRNALYPLFSIFDYGDAGVPIAQRSSTTVSHQALFMLNSELVMEQAAALAEDLKQSESDDTKRLAKLYERLFARLPMESETARALRFLDHASQLAVSEKQKPELSRDIAWQRLCHALLASSEFIYVD